MPIIKIYMTPTTKEIKKELIEKLAQTMCYVANKPKESVTIIINETSADNIGTAGKQLSEIRK